MVLAEGCADVRLAVHDEQRRLDVLNPRECVAARVDFRALCRRPAVARLREDLAEPIGIGQRIGKVVNPRHGNGGVVLVRIPGDRRHGHDAAVAVAVDADLAVHVRQRPHEIGGNRGIVCLTARPVVHAEILELAPETGAAAIVDGEDDVALRGQVLLDEVLGPEIGVGAASVHVDERRIAGAVTHVRGEIQETLDVQPIERSIGDFLRLANALPFLGEPGELAWSAAPGRHVERLRTGRRTRSNVDERVAFGRRVERAQCPALVGDARGHTAGRRGRPQVEIAAFVIDEVEISAVARPEHRQAVEPVGRGDLHLDRALRALRHVDDPDVLKVLVPVALLRCAEQGHCVPVRRPHRCRRRHQALRELTRLSRRHVHHPHVVVPVVSLVRDEGDLLAIRRPRRREARIVLGHGGRRELTHGLPAFG